MNLFIKPFVLVLIISLFLSEAGYSQSAACPFYLTKQKDYIISGTSVAIMSLPFVFKGTFGKTYTLSPEEIGALDASDVNWLDRYSTRIYAEVLHKTSNFLTTAGTLGAIGGIAYYSYIDVSENGSGGTAAALGVMYVEGLIFSQGLANFMNMAFDRPIPLAYNTELKEGERSSFKRNNASFFDPVSTLAFYNACFMGQVVSAYKPGSLLSKYVWYGGLGIASVASMAKMFSGYRYLTDVFVGAVIGAGTGLLIPHLHHEDYYRFTMLPYTGEVSGLYLSYRF